MSKIIKPYPIMMDNWQLALPADSKIISFEQIGSVGYMFVLQDASEARRMTERRFMTVPANRVAEMTDDHKFVGAVKMIDPTQQVPLSIMLFVFEKTAPIIHRVQ